MDYAIQLLLPIVGGLMLGMWLTKTYGLNPIWTVLLAVLGMIGGIGILYRRFAPTPVDPKTIQSHTGKHFSPEKHKPKAPQQNSVHHTELDFMYEPHTDDDAEEWPELNALDRDDDSTLPPPSNPKR